MAKKNLVGALIGGGVVLIILQLIPVTLIPSFLIQGEIITARHKRSKLVLIRTKT